MVNADGHTSDLATATPALWRALSQRLKAILKYAKAYIEKIAISNTALTITRSVPKTVVRQPDRLHISEQLGGLREQNIAGTWWKDGGYNNRKMHWNNGSDRRSKKKSLPCLSWRA